MEESAKMFLRRIVRRIPSMKLRDTLSKWDRLTKTQLHSLDFTKPKWLLCELLMSLCQENGLSLKHLTEIEMLYHIEYPNQENWNGYQLLDAQEDEFGSPDWMQFREQFKAQLKDLISHVSIKMKKHEDDCVWVRIAWGDNFNRPNHLKPTYVVHHLQTPYAFISSLTNKHKPLLFQALAVAAGYSSVKDVHLSGRCLASLTSLLMRQYSQVFPSPQPTQLQETDPLTNPNIENEHAKLMQYKQQMAIQAFGKTDLPKLQTAVYKLETKYREHGTEIQNVGIRTRDEPFRGVVKFTSSNLLESLKCCVVSGMASGSITPLLSSITQKGRNYFVIKDKGLGVTNDTPGPKI